MSIDLKPTSRMLNTPLINRNGTEYFDIWEPIVFPESDNDIVHTVIETQVGRLDLIAVMYYNDPTLWWVIAHANKVEDVFEEIVPGMRIRIPAFSSVQTILNDASS